jgi:predicted thioesterase
MELAAGAHSRLERVVTEADTAVALGSGDVPVLATPCLLAWLEAATVAALNGRLDDAQTSVGWRIELEHRAATGVGAAVSVTADLVAVDGRLLRFSVAAHDASDRLLATGEVTRVVVDRERFLARL